MKLLSVAIPCYNSAPYMRNCIESLLPGGDEVEILIVDDGSTKDNTAEIADEYERNYPGICRAIHQENGGHGEAVNADHAQCDGRLLYASWTAMTGVNEEAYMEVLDTLRKFVHDNVTLGWLITNFVYEKQGAKHKKVMNYNMALPKRQLIDWNGARGFRLGQYILMHSVIYRVEMLQAAVWNCRSTHSMDNIFVYQPLPQVKSMYYLDVNFYRYFIGRDDQSVNEKVMIGRIDQQILVTKLMLGYYDVTKIKNPKLRHYMVRYLEIMMTVTSILTIRSETEENLKKKKELWQYLKQQNFTLYMRLRWGFLGQGVTCREKADGECRSPAIRFRRSFMGLTRNPL